MFAADGPADGNLTKEVDGRAIETDQTFDATERRTRPSYPSDTAPILSDQQLSGLDHQVRHRPPPAWPT